MMIQPQNSQLEAVEALILPLIEEAGLELYDVTLTAQRGRRVLRVAVDRPGGSAPGEGVQLADIVELNREISALLDLEDPIAGRYRLDVESPGVERPLRRSWHFQRVVGQQIHVVLRDPVEERSAIDGSVAEVEETTLTIEMKNGERLIVPMASIKKAHTIYEW